jgi:AraC-like DNA-binding protein
MSEKLNSLFVIVNFGSLILLSFLSLANPVKANQIASRLLGVFFLIWACFSADEITLLLYNMELDQKWHLLLRSIQYFAPILFYLIVVFYSNPSFKFKKAILKHLILPVCFISLLYYYGQSQSAMMNYVLIALMLGQAIFYISASYIRIRKHQKVVLLFSSQKEEVDLFWLERIIIAMLLLTVVVIFYNIVFSLERLNLSMNGVVLIVIFYIAFHSMRQKEIYPFKEANIEEIISISEEPVIDDTKKKIVSDEELNLLQTQLAQFMEKQKPYLDPDLNLIKLANNVEVSTHRLSYVINSGFNMNFFNFVNKYRVEEAKLLLLNSKKEHYSILGIANEAGFSSKSAFNTTFKKVTGQTPSDFKNRGSVL